MVEMNAVYFRGDNGEIIEEAPTEVLFSRPLHPYTRMLLDSRPGQREPDPDAESEPAVLAPELPAQGCRFAPRCPIARPECSQEHPELEAAGDRHLVRCPVTGTG